MKIGFVDDYLDNWHSNHYPSYIKLASALYGIPAEVTYAYAWRDHPSGGMTTAEWCATQGILQCTSYDELLEKSDAIMVMCADNCLPHEELSNKALMCQKPVYCDKTFAPTLEAAQRMFQLAESCKTPVFSCSAQRFCMELLCFQAEYPEPLSYCCSTGPGDMVNYSIHQFEMLEALMGTGARRCLANDLNGSYQLLFDYGNNKTCVFRQGDKFPFTLQALTARQGMLDIAVTDYYLNFMLKLLQFFEKDILPVRKEDTLEIMAMQQAGREAIKCPGRWIPVPQV